MSSTPPNRRVMLSIFAVGFGLFAVAAATASFFTEAVWGLRATALVLIILGLALGRMAMRQPPPADGA